jgi:hypothetical protein
LLESLHPSDEEGSSSTSSNGVLFSPPEMLNMTVEEYRACLQVSWGKRLAVLHSGHIGIVPQNATLGDTLVIALGCTMPLVLRPQNTRVSRFIGESYFHGVMGGELMTGYAVAETITLE